jgi:phosphate transport system substrate-binding protein
MQGTAAVVSAVSKEKNGIGYGGAAYAKGITVLAVKKDAAAPGVLPDQANVANGSYPLSRPLFFYLRNKPSGETKSFVDWVLSPEGQSVVTKVGYFPIQ